MMASPRKADLIRYALQLNEGFDPGGLTVAEIKAAIHGFEVTKYGPEFYAEVAEELGGDLTLEDLDTDLAEEWAKQNHKAWPPHPTDSGWQVTIWSSGGPLLDGGAA